jgi:hypothetical protein
LTELALKGETEMATRKAAKKSTKKSPAKKKPTKRPKPRRKATPGNDPIIVGGGSVFLDFDTRFGGITAPPGKRKFQDPSVNLVEVVVLNSVGAILHRYPLSRTDKVVVCYTGSKCPPDAIPGRRRI